MSSEMTDFPEDEYVRGVHEAMQENFLTEEYKQMRIEELLMERSREKSSQPRHAQYYVNTDYNSPVQKQAQDRSPTKSEHGSADKVNILLKPGLEHKAHQRKLQQNISYNGADGPGESHNPMEQEHFQSTLGVVDSFGDGDGRTEEKENNSPRVSTLVEEYNTKKRNYLAVLGRLNDHIKYCCDKKMQIEDQIRVMEKEFQECFVKECSGGVSLQSSEK
eukprot:Nk52_evm33s1737 gene=Nk52_evmTU33s1737